MNKEANQINLCSLNVYHTQLLNYFPIRKKKNVCNIFLAYDFSYRYKYGSS